MGLMNNEMDNYECGTQVSRPESHSNANRSPVIILLLLFLLCSIIFMMAMFNVRNITISGYR